MPYRRENVRQLRVLISMKRTVFSPPQNHWIQLLVVYRGSLRRILTLKAGALQVLEALKACRKRVILVLRDRKMRRNEPSQSLA
ncbi:hypothetical protein BDW75DRAFT_196752 [Aspergillus navahoensis]